MSKFNRRAFLKYGLSASSLAGLGLLPFHPLRAEEAEDHFLVLITVPMGMDATLGLDPLTHAAFQTSQEDVFLEYRPEDIVKAGNLKFAPAAASLKPHFKDICVVNGVVMRESQSHDSQMRYIITGSGMGSSADVAIELADHSSATMLGHLYQGENFLGANNTLKTNLRSFENLQNGVILKEIIDGKQAEDPNLVAAYSSYVNFQKVGAEIQEKLNKLKELHSSADSLALAAAVGLSMGLSSTASINMESMTASDSIELDTHSNHEGTHLAGQTLVWSSISNIFSLFKSVEHKGASLFDHTTFMVATEFSRTPYLNGTKGKDHNPLTNSVLFAGKNIKGNTTIGQSRVISRERAPRGRAIHIGAAYDYKAGKSLLKAPENFDAVGLIYPENVVASLKSVFPGKDVFSNIHGRSIEIFS